MCYFGTFFFNIIGMKKIFLLVFLFIILAVQAQSEQLANNYFDRGDFEKALLNYEDLLKTQPGNFNYFIRTIECFQQLQKYDSAEKSLQDRVAKYKQGNTIVELGYNYQLQKEQNKADKYYEEAIDKIVKTPNEVYSVA